MWPRELKSPPEVLRQESGSVRNSNPAPCDSAAQTLPGSLSVKSTSQLRLAPRTRDSPSAPVNVTVRHLKANSAVVSWDVLEDEVVIGFAISQQKKDVRMLRFIQEVNTTTRSCALWDLEEDTEYIVHVQAISIQGQSPASEPVLFKTPREAEKMASKNKDEVTMKEMGRNQQLRTGEVLIIVVVLFMWAGVIALFCRQYDIIKDNEPNNNKEKTKSASETSTPEHQGGGLLRSKI
uniref:Fibronectin type III domain containing 5 n=1 Tax=Ictidomys tridecemlineatus TaxID=43179 RepID=I3LYV6_ICTTR